MMMDEILDRVLSFPDAMVEITGGEPLLQPPVHILIEKLVNCGKNVLVETNGSFSLAPIPIAATAIMDIKCPGSGGASFLTDNIHIIRERAALRAGATEIKFVVSSLADYTWAKEIILKYDLLSIAPVLISPVRSLLPIRLLAEAILEDALPVRLQVQLHTVIWPDVQRGV